VAIWPGNIRRANRSTVGVKDICMAFSALGVLSPERPKTVEQNAQTVEVVEMAVGYINGLQVAVVQSDPNPREPRPQPPFPIASTSTASYSPKIKVDVIGSKRALRQGPWPLADHRLSRGRKNVHTKRVQDDRHGHARVSFSPFATST